MGPWLEGGTGDVVIIRALINNLKKRDLPASGRLLCYARDVRKMIDAYRLDEVHTMPYYSRLLNILYHFANCPILSVSTCRTTC